MRKIHEPFSRMTETGDGYHSNEVRVKKKLDRKSTTEKVQQKKFDRKSSGSGGRSPWNRRVEKSADRDDEGRNGRGRPER